MLNTILLMGRLTADPELKHTPNGVAVATFTIAVDRDVKNQDGGYDVDFINIVAWRQTGEFAAQYFQKGQLAVVKGRLQLRKYQDKNGQNRITPEVVADRVYFGGGQKRDQQQADHGFTPPPDGRGTQAAGRQQKPFEYGEFEDVPLDDGDLPF